ncbi:unnamed protein product [Ambrosiozyma monospora]|uniref:Unnamed protein product n=1 Tax=Ambrosiozyma monospora TaxID=43982 RepID=A0ACB5T2I3_AMBMO|nr:unnamed protein product [Ambrosiozyma monospora]
MVKRVTYGQVSSVQESEIPYKQDDVSSFISSKTVKWKSNQSQKMPISPYTDHDSINEVHLQFAASTNTIIPMYHLISSILPFGKNCLLTITSTGLLFSIIDNNVCKITLTLDKRLFSSYDFSPINITSTLSPDGQDQENDDGNEDYNISKDEDEEEETEPESDDEEGQRRYKERKQFIQLQRQKHKEEQRRQMEDSQFLPVNLDLKSFLETINLHLPSEKEGPESKVKCILSYQGDGYPFLLTFEDELIIEKCELHTLMIEERERESMAVTKKQKKNGRRPNNDNYGLDNGMDLEDESPEEEDYDASFVDSSIFQIDLSKIIFDTVLQKSVLFDVENPECCFLYLDHPMKLLDFPKF